jgi:phosphohistidine phosphatase SixA
LTDLGWVPDLILSSDSQRTQETYEAMSDGFADEVPVEFHRSMYHAGLQAILHEAPGVPDDVNTLMVLGHNPGWEEVVERLSDEFATMKTASAALLEGQGDSWPDALAGKWSLVDIIHAREL